MSEQKTSTETEAGEGLPLARQLVRCFSRWCRVDEPLLAPVLEQLCAGIQSGDTCWTPDETLVETLGVAPWELAERLERTELAGPPESQRPLVLDGQGHVYFRREWRLERRLAHKLVRHLKAASIPLGQESRSALEAAFADDYPEPRRAAELGATAPLGMVCGGPGTGKTTGVLRFLKWHLRLHPELVERTALCAPTGKAAARLREGIATSAALPSAIQSKLSERVGTVHRLLRPFGPPGKFRHGPANPLPHALVIVDEASMLDNHLLTHLLEALLPTARVLLLGDPDQLASVESGAAFGELVRVSENARVSLANEALPQAQQPLRILETDTAVARELPRALGERTVRLTRNFRFASQPGIAGLCEAICLGDAGRALAILHDASLGDVQLQPVRTPTPLANEAFRDALLASVQPLLDASTIEEALGRLQASQVLCVLRQGPFGVEGVQRRLLQRLGVASSRAHLPDGMPVTLLRNAPRLGRVNGDVGVAWKDGGQQAVWFADSCGEPTRVSLPSLPEWTSGPALTVHRSQGSEYGEVHVLLPPEEHPLLSRELIYTAASRARQRLTIWGSEAALRWAIQRPTRRQSGLLTQMQQIWNEPANEAR